MSTQLDRIAKKAKSEPEAAVHLVGAFAHAGVSHGNLEADKPPGCEWRGRRNSKGI